MYVDHARSSLLPSPNPNILVPISRSTHTPTHTHIHKHTYTHRSHSPDNTRDRPHSHLLWEGIEEPGPLRFERHPHAGHERRVEHHAAELVPRRQVDGGHGTDALAVQDHRVGRDAVPAVQRLPRRLDVGVQVLLRRPARAVAVARVVVAEDVAVDARAEPQIEAAHLSEVHGVPVREQHRVFGTGAALDVHARDAVALAGARVEGLHGLLLLVGVEPVGALGEDDVVLVARLVGHQTVGGLGRQEGQLAGDPRRTRRTAEQAAELGQTQTVHGCGAGRSSALPAHGEAHSGAVSQCVHSVTGEY